MKPKTRQCADCEHAAWGKHACACTKGHRLRFYIPRDALDRDCGYKRRCADYKEKKR